MSAREKRKEKIGKVAYTLFLIIWVGVLAVAVAFAWKMLWSYCEEYENSDSSHIVKTYMEELNETKWNDAMQTAAESLQNEFQTADECVAYVKSTLTGDLQYSSTASSGDTIAYRLGFNNIPIGSVQFEEDQSYADKVKFGMLPWKVAGDEFNFDYLKTGSASVTVPADYVVKINGITLDEKYITEKDIPYDVLKNYYDQFEGLPTKVTYAVGELVGPVEPEVYDTQGNLVTIDPTADDSQFITPMAESETAEFRAFADAFVEPYQQYFGTKNVDANYPVLSQYVMKGSALQSLMDDFKDGAGWIHTYSVVINDKKFNSVYELGGGFYVINETVTSTSYQEYKTVEETTDLKIIVYKDGTGSILAVNVA